MYERLLITFAIAASFAMVWWFIRSRQFSAANRSSQVLNKSAPIPTIVYFWSNGCPVCKMTQRKILDGIVSEYGKERLAFTTHNTDEEPDVAKEWRVMTLPTTFLLDSTGAIKHVNNGLADSETLRKQLEPMMRMRSNC